KPTRRSEQPTRWLDNQPDGCYGCGMPSASTAVTPSTGDFAPFGRTAALAVFAALFVLSQLYGVIPLLGHIANTLSVPAGSAALVQSMFGIAYATGFVLWGVVVDRFGARRVMVLGLALSIPATFAIGVAPTLTWVLIIRAVQGLVSASFAPAAFSYIGR